MPLKKTALQTPSRNLFFRSSLGLLLMSLLVSSCVEESGPEDPGAIRDNYLGRWNVSENTGRFAPQFYQVEITAGSTLSEVIVEGLYNEPSTRVRMNINGQSISIPNQITDDINFRGTGTANSDYTTLNLSFTVNDGSGTDNVEAVLNF